MTSWWSRKGKKGREPYFAQNLYSWVLEWENKTILIHFVGDRKHQVDRIQGTKDAYNRESIDEADWLDCAEIFSSNENATLFLWVTWDSPSRMCRGNSKSSFPYSLETSIFERFRRSRFSPSHTSEFLNFRGLKRNDATSLTSRKVREKHEEKCRVKNNER